MNLRDVPKWVFSAAFALLVVLLAISLFRGEPISVHGQPWGFGRASQHIAAGDGWVQVGETLISWGQDTKVVGQSGRLSFPFPRAFDREPTVSVSTGARSQGTMYAFYDLVVERTQFTVKILEVQDRPSSAPALVSYIAVGTAAE